MEATLSHERATTASDALRHPMRLRILEALNTRDLLSPIQFLRAGHAGDLPGLEGKSLRVQMSHVSYHFGS